jgi:hypothetical protein
MYLNILFRVSGRSKAVMRRPSGILFSPSHNGGAHGAPARERSGAKGTPRATEPASLRQGYGGPPKRFARRRGCGAKPHMDE